MKYNFIKFDDKEYGGLGNMDAIEETFKEREKFIDLLSDQEIRQANYCPVHKLYYREDECSICRGEKNFKEVVKEIKEKGLLVGTKDKEFYLKEKEKKKIKDREYMRKRLEDPDTKKKHYLAVNKYYKKEQARKKEHSLISS